MAMSQTLVPQRSPFTICLNLVLTHGPWHSYTDAYTQQKKHTAIPGTVFHVPWYCV
jgi:hypothetical protein